MLSQIAGFFSKYALQLLGAALLASMVGNVALGLVSKHYIAKAATCQAATKHTNAVAKQRKAIVEHRQNKVTHESQDRITDRIADATRRLRDSESRKPHLSYAPLASSSPSAEGREALVLPSGDEQQAERDKAICVTNTIIAEEWQNFYGQLLTIQEEEAVGQPLDAPYPNTE